MRPVFLFTLGAFLMTAAAAPTDGQEKKAPKLDPPFDQVVKVEGKDDKGNPFVKEGVPAYRPATKAPIWRVSSRAIGDLHPNMGPKNAIVVTDKDGKVYKIEKVTGLPPTAFQLWIDEPAPKP